MTAPTYKHKASSVSRQSQAAKQPRATPRFSGIGNRARQMLVAQSHGQAAQKKRKADPKSGCETLEQRAAKESKQGSTELSEALAGAYMKPQLVELSANRVRQLPHFSISTRANRVRITIETTPARASTDNSNVPVEDSVTASLRNADNEKVGGELTVAAPGSASLEWRLTAPQRYQLQLDPRQDLRVRVWMEVAASQGEAVDRTDAYDLFEAKAGTTTSSTNATGRALGQYVLRSEPVPESYIFGTLPGRPTNVRVLDKRSYDREAEEHTIWYKIQLGERDFEKNAICPPPAQYRHALEMYRKRTAWVTGESLKVYLPFGDFLTFVRAFEAEHDIAKLPLGRRITRLRQLYSESQLDADDLLGTEEGPKTVEDRPALSGLHQMLKKSTTGVTLPDGTRVDAGHVVLSLDAFNQPQAPASRYLIPAGSRHAVATWSGDVGATVGNYMIEHLEKGLTGVDRTLFHTHNQRSAPDDDLLGNIDGIAASRLMAADQTGEITTIEQLLGKLYGYNVKRNTIDPDRVRSSRALGIEALLRTHRFTKPQSLLQQTSGVEDVVAEVRTFGRLWFVQHSIESAARALTPSVRKLLERVSRLAARDFLQRMERFATNVGLTSFADVVQKRDDEARSSSKTEQASAIRGLAQRGLEGSGRGLPHLEAVQRGFGAFDLSDVQAFVGGPAAVACQQIGAKAFASGDRVAFYEQPDVRTAAHEAAHVIQQRAGMRPVGRVGTIGDRYERHADAVADAVITGASAQPLLEHMVGPAPVKTSTGARTVQCQGQRDKPRDVRGLGGYLYRQYPDGVIEILDAPNNLGVGRRLPVGNRFNRRITAEIGPYSEVEAETATDPELVLHFNGKHLWFEGDDSYKLTVRAVSGLKRNASIRKFRARGVERADYTDPKYQNLEGVGPIPAGTYRLNLAPGVPPDRLGGGWGIAAWRLLPASIAGTALEYIDALLDEHAPEELRLERRGGFYLHQDAGNDGTAGCIGITGARPTRRVWNRLKQYQRSGRSQIRVVVEY